MKFLRSALLLLVLMVGLMPVAAQTDFTEDEQALIDEVYKAFESVLALDSVRNVATQVIEQDISFMGQSIQQTVLQETESVVLIEDGVTVAAQGFTTQTMEGGLGIDGATTFEIIYVDDALYMQATEATGLFAGGFPAGWVNVTENPAGFPGGEGINLEQLSALTFPISEETIQAIEAVELPEEDVVEEAVRAIYVSLNSQALLEYGIAEALADSFVESGLGFDVEAMVDALLQDAAWDMIIYTNEAGLLVQIDMVLTISADLGPAIGLDSMLIDQVLSSTTVYLDFNEPVEIVAPIE